jgi:hypothetical protein
MRAKFIKDFITKLSDYNIGDRKKQLSSGDVYQIINMGNISGGGDLFIHNENTGKDEKCFSNDWADMRKFSSVILEFQQGQDPYKIMGLGAYQVGTELIVTHNIDWSTNGKDIRKWVESEYNLLSVGTKLYVTEINVLMSSKFDVGNSEDDMLGINIDDDRGEDYWISNEDAHKFLRRVNK